MSAGTIVAIVVVVIIVAALIAVASLAARRRRLQQRFGPEYNRVVEDSDSKLKAEAELAGREKRVRQFDIRPLGAAARDSYARQWTAIQEQFVDSPANAVTGAQSLITSVMKDRGYPTEDADQIMADLSVEHASTIEQFRTAQELSGRAAGGTASTEDLRLAMVHYRALFRDLLGTGADDMGADGTVADDMAADDTPVDTTPVDTTPVDDMPVDHAPVDDPPVYATDTERVNAVPTDTVPAGETEPDEPETEQDDETSVAAAGRLPRRR
jgi:hypothetical protein